MDPIVFKAKDGRFGDGRRNINFKRNVIRSSSVRKELIPTHIDEHSVQPL